MTTTQWTPRQQELAKTSDPNALLDCNLYLIFTRDPWKRTTEVIVGYVGETARQPLDRLLEHIRKQWFARDFRGFLVVMDPQTGEPKVFASKAEVWAEERRLVEEYEPPYNREYNGSNRWLVIDGVGVHFDLPPNQPDWWPDGSKAAPVAVQPTPLGAFGRWWHSVRPWVIGAPVSWLGTTVLLLWAALTWTHMAVLAAMKGGALLAGVLVGGGVAVKLLRWWLARRKRKREAEQRTARREKAAAKRKSRRR
jgi:hypothetical protein